MVWPILISVAVTPGVSAAIDDAVIPAAVSNAAIVVTHSVVRMFPSCAVAVDREGRSRDRGRAAHSAAACRSRQASDWRRQPGPVDDTAFWTVEPHGKIEWSRRRRQPVRSLVGAGIGGGDDDLERTVGIERESVAVADSVAIEGVGDRISVAVVERDRPERVDWRQLAFLEADDVAAGAVERLAAAVNGRRGIDRILRQVGGRERPLDGRALQIAGAVDAHGIGVDAPAIGVMAETRRLLEG